jgi:hypothetical protein
LPGSIAENELTNFAQPDKVKDAYIQGNFLIEGVADHLVAFTRTVTEPAGSISPWTCTRAALESAALASWLMQTGIDVNERVKRSFTFRYEGLRQQLKVVRAANQADKVTTVENRIHKVENDAMQLGHPQITNYHGITSIIASTFDEEITYRLMSAVAHGHLWAIHQVGFKLEDGENLILHKHLEPLMAAFLCIKIANFLAKPVWLKCQLFGWDSDRLRSILASTFTDLGSSWVEP